MPDSRSSATGDAAQRSPKPVSETGSSIRTIVTAASAMPLHTRGMARALPDARTRLRSARRSSSAETKPPSGASGSSPKP